MLISGVSLPPSEEDGQCLRDFEPLTKFVSGVGGTGKSFLTEAVKVLVRRVWTDDEVTVVVVAPTSLAAFNVHVDGLTIHRLFQLPIEHALNRAWLN